MPHVTIEFSAELAQLHDIQGLCDEVFRVLAAHPAVPDPETLKIRALPCPFSRSGSDSKTCAHADLRLLPGRDGATKAGLAEAILAVMSERLASAGSLSVDVAELSAAYKKREL